MATRSCRRSRVSRSGSMSLVLGRSTTTSSGSWPRKILVEAPPRRGSDDARRKYYRLTRLGRRVLSAEIARLDDVVRVARNSPTATVAREDRMIRRLYSWILFLHPGGFRAAFGAEMLWIFEQARDRRQQTALLADALVSLVRQWTVRGDFRDTTRVAPGSPSGGPLLSDDSDAAHPLGSPSQRGRAHAWKLPPHWNGDQLRRASERPLRADRPASERQAGRLAVLSRNGNRAEVQLSESLPPASPGGLAGGPAAELCARRLIAASGNARL